VTVTGAPKPWAMQFLEDNERSPRAWYGGAVGRLGFDGNLDSGLTLRTIRLRDGIAEVRAGATLLYDSDPDAEEQETRLKAAALLDAIRRPRAQPATSSQMLQLGVGKRILLLDHHDSFVHTLANYLRQTGANVFTLRAGVAPGAIADLKPHLVLLSPGPGTPSDFEMAKTIDTLVRLGVPTFGVCLGLQGMIEHAGGKLAVLDYPMHGKASLVRVFGGGRLFEGLPQQFTAGRYHSLYAVRDKIPAAYKTVALSDDKIVMAIEHTKLPLAAVQFHPESIMSLEDNLGLRLLQNVVAYLARPLEH
jgi:anthranilate synthase